MAPPYFGISANPKPITLLLRWQTKAGIPKEPYDKSQSCPNEPQRKKKPIFANGLIQTIDLVKWHSLIFSSFGTFDLLAIQVCNPPDIQQGSKPLAILLYFHFCFQNNEKSHNHSHKRTILGPETI